MQNSFNQTRFDTRETVPDAGALICAPARKEQHDSVRLHRLDELEGQPVAHFHGTCIDDQDISIDNFTSLLPTICNMRSAAKQVEETLVSHLLKSNCRCL